jgi:DnaJ-domain-containing protein 1
MGNGRRAYDLLRGYVNQEWERIRGVDDKDALTELNESVSITSTRVERSVTIQQEIIAVNPPDWARRILGVSPTADFTEIRQAFEKLNTRSDPSKFPAGSAEAQQASEIQLRVQQAYAILTDAIDSTEKRFKSLEID